MPLSILGSFLRGQTPSPSQATTTAKHVDHAHDPPNTPSLQRAAMTRGPQDTIISPAPSRPVSSGSSAADVKTKKRAPRSKTSYIIAKPPQPVNPRSKLHIRPKVLLQLHQIIASQRPKPVYEVIPFSLLPQRSTRRLARTFNTRERLGPNDLLIVKAEAYSTKDEEARSDDERWGSREVIGVISPGKCERGIIGKPEICMDDGTSRWEVTNMPNGGYEFNTTDDHGLNLKARWVLKPAQARRVSSMTAASPLTPTFAPGQEDKKFTFSTISANSRRHPIIATMTRTRIDVLDSYAMPSATSPPTPSSPSYTQSPAMTPSSIDTNSFLDNSSTTLPIETDDALRRFIVVSGVWVASHHFTSSDNSQPPTPSLNTSATFRPPNHRTVSMPFIESPRSASPASTVDENRRSFPKMFRTGTERLPRSTSFTEPCTSPVSTKISPSSSPKLKTRGRRANSTGNTQFISMTGSMRRRYGLAFTDQAPQESEEEKQSKRSIELLRIKELALSSPLDRSSIETPVRESKPKSAAIPSPIIIPCSSDDATAPTPLLSPPLPSPPLPDPERARKTQSAYNPLTTAGLWDSGVTEGPGLKRRPTSMFVMSERKRKQDKKRSQSKSKENRKEEKRASIEDKECLGLKRKGDWYKYKFKLSLKGLFRKGEKA
ncbi:Nn.00g046730.m01.CDS01 [Neocucurbitaria sp. VM-36]